MLNKTSKYVTKIAFFKNNKKRKGDGGVKIDADGAQQQQSETIFAGRTRGVYTRILCEIDTRSSLCGHSPCRRPAASERQRHVQHPRATRYTRR